MADVTSKSDLHIILISSLYFQLHEYFYSAVSIPSALTKISSYNLILLTLISFDW